MDDIARESIEFKEKQVKINENVIRFYQDLIDEHNELSCPVTYTLLLIRCYGVNKSIIRTTNIILSGSEYCPINGQ